MTIKPNDYTSVSILDLPESWKSEALKIDTNPNSALEPDDFLVLPNNTKKPDNWVGQLLSSLVQKDQKDIEEQRQCGPKKDSFLDFDTLEKERVQKPIKIEYITQDFVIKKLPFAMRLRWVNTLLPLAKDDKKIAALLLKLVLESPNHQCHALASILDAKGCYSLLKEESKTDEDKKKLRTWFNNFSPITFAPERFSIKKSNRYELTHALDRFGLKDSNGTSVDITQRLNFSHIINNVFYGFDTYDMYTEAGRPLASSKVTQSRDDNSGSLTIEVFNENDAYLATIKGSVKEGLQSIEINSADHNKIPSKEIYTIKAFGEGLFKILDKNNVLIYTVTQTNETTEFNPTQTPHSIPQIALRFLAYHMAEKHYRSNH